MTRDDWRKKRQAEYRCWCDTCWRAFLSRGRLNECGVERFQGHGRRSMTNLSERLRVYAMAESQMASGYVLASKDDLRQAAALVEERDTLRTALRHIREQGDAWAAEIADQALAARGGDAT